MTAPDWDRVAEAVETWETFGLTLEYLETMSYNHRVALNAAARWALQHGPAIDNAINGLRVFVGKHPCDDGPHIVGVTPDPRSDEFRGRYGFKGLAAGGTDFGEDYSGYYVRVPKEWVERRLLPGEGE